MRFNNKKTTEEILAQIEIDKINAKSTAKEIASKHLGKHAINYITILYLKKIKYHLLKQ